VSRTRPVILENCKVPKENLLGKEGDGFKIAMSGLNGGRINIGSCSLGGAQKCLDLATNYVKERKQFGQTIASFQNTQFEIAKMLIKLEASRLMIRSAAHALDNKDPESTVKCAMAKNYSTDVGFEVANSSLQLLGGYGYTKEYQIERYLRDLRVHQILEGSNEVMKLIISRHHLNN
jgi:alkylation response protein AidB-like acyl-CoA dehydrogenase